MSLTARSGAASEIARLLSKAWIYTALAEGMPPQAPARSSQGARLVAFLGEGVPARGWEARRLRGEARDASPSPYKSLSHRHFPSAECTLWLDGGIAFRSGLDVDGLLRGFARAGADLLVFRKDREGPAAASTEVVFRMGNNRVKRFNELWAWGMGEGLRSDEDAFEYAARESCATLKYLPSAGRRFFTRALRAPAHDDQTMID